MHETLVNAVVAICSAESFKGSAFFLSDRHILTAKHVLINERDKKLNPDVRVKTRSRFGWITVSPEQVHEHPTLDVALICLQHGETKQSYIDVTKIREGVSGEAVDIQGVKLTKTGNLDEDYRYNHTLGNYDHTERGYEIDHQVLLGNSGGLVASQDAAIGLIIERNTNDQRSIHLALSVLKPWLKKQAVPWPDINRLDLQEVLDTSGPDLALPLYDLRVIIDRPKRTRAEIETSVQQRPVEGFVCVMSSSSHDQPDEFSRGLLLRLEDRRQASEVSDRQLFDALNNTRLRVERLPVDPRDISSPEDFSKRIDEAVFRELGGHKRGGSSGVTNEAKRRSRIISLMQDAELPRVYFLTESLTAKKGNKWFPSIWLQSSRKSVERALGWMDAWNRNWAPRDSIDGNPVPPLVFLYFVEVDEKVLSYYRESQAVGDRVSHPSGEANPLLTALPLTKIEEQDFSLWCGEAREILKAGFQSHEHRLGSIVEQARKDIDRELKKESQSFPLYYQQFSEKCQRVFTKKDECP